MRIHSSSDWPLFKSNYCLVKSLIVFPLKLPMSYGVKLILKVVDCFVELSTCQLNTDER